MSWPATHLTSCLDDWYSPVIGQYLLDLTWVSIILSVNFHHTIRLKLKRMTQWKCWRRSAITKMPEDYSWPSARFMVHGPLCFGRYLSLRISHFMSLFPGTYLCLVGMHENSCHVQMLWKHGVLLYLSCTTEVHCFFVVWPWCVWEEKSFVAPPHPRWWHHHALICWSLWPWGYAFGTMHILMS